MEDTLAARRVRAVEEQSVLAPAPSPCQAIPWPREIRPPSRTSAPATWSYHHQHKRTGRLRRPQPPRLLDNRDDRTKCLSQPSAAPVDEGKPRRQNGRASQQEMAPHLNRGEAACP